MIRYGHCERGGRRDKIRNSRCPRLGRLVDEGWAVRVVVKDASFEWWRRGGGCSGRDEGVVGLLAEGEGSYML